MYLLNVNLSHFHRFSKLLFFLNLRSFFKSIFATQKIYESVVLRVKLWSDFLFFNVFLKTVKKEKQPESLILTILAH